MSDFFDNVDVYAKPSDAMNKPVNKEKNDWQFVAFCELIYDKTEHHTDEDRLIREATKIIVTRLRMFHRPKTEIEYEASVCGSDVSVTDSMRTSSEKNRVICVKVCFSGTFGSIKASIEFMKCINVFDVIDFAPNVINVSYGILKVQEDDSIGYNHKFYIDRKQFSIKNAFFEMSVDSKTSFFMDNMNQVAECCSYMLEHNSLIFKTTNECKTNLVTENTVKSIINFFDSKDILAIFNNMKTLVVWHGIYHPAIDWIVFANPSEYEYGYKEKYEFDFCDKIMFKAMPHLENVIRNSRLKVSVSRIEDISVNKYDPGKDVATDWVRINEWFKSQIPFSKKRWIRAIYRIDTEKDIMTAGFCCGHTYVPNTDKYYINTIAICGETEVTIKTIKEIFNE